MQVKRIGCNLCHGTGNMRIARCKTNFPSVVTSSEISSMGDSLIVEEEVPCKNCKLSEYEAVTQAMDLVRTINERSVG